MESPEPERTESSSVGQSDRSIEPKERFIISDAPASIRKRQYEDFSNPRISIVDLMVITAICAVAISIITSVGFPGTPVMFLACLGANTYLAGYLDERPVKFRFWNQFTWGVLMPLICIFGDPFVFGKFDFGKVLFINDHGFGCYAFVGWQILFLAISWVIGKEHQKLNEFVAGTLMAGGFFSLVVGLLISPLTFLGAIFLGISLAGLTPFFTGIVFLQTSRMLLARVHDKNSPFRISWVLLGFVIAISVGVLAYFAAIYFQLGFDVNIELQEFGFT